jgi:hypothetical protein
VISSCAELEEIVTKGVSEGELGRPKEELTSLRDALDISAGTPGTSDCL